MLVGPNLITWANQHPASASATAMFIATLNSMSGTITVIILKKLNIYYALALCAMAAIGTIPGIWMQHWLVKRTGRPSITVGLLSFFIIFSIVATIIVGVRVITQEVDEGKLVLEVNPYCPAEELTI